MSNRMPISVSPSSSTSTTRVALKPNEYTKGLDQEHVVRLTEDAYKHFAEYTKAELNCKKKRWVIKIMKKRLIKKV